MTGTEELLDLASLLWKPGGQGIWSRWDSTWSTGSWRQSAPPWSWSRRTGSSPSSTSWSTHVAPLWYLSHKYICFAFMSCFFLVYYLGIEDNRRQAREHFQSHVRIFKRRKDDSQKLKSKNWLKYPASDENQQMNCPQMNFRIRKDGILLHKFIHSLFYVLPLCLC